MSQIDVMLPQERLPCAAAKPSVDELVLVEPTEFLVDKQLDKSEFRLLNLDGAACDLKAESRKKRHRRGKRRKWKPYSKLTWDERKELEERDSRRANRIRAEMSSSGLTLAPYNTTQFLMEDHNLQEPDYEHIHNGQRHRTNSNSMDSSDEYYSSPEDEEDFLEREFRETYENIHVERLNSMTKTELVQELMCMEDKVETLEKSLQDDRLQRDSVGTDVRLSDQDLEAQLEKIRVYREEIKKLAEENDRMKKEKERLRSQSTSTDESNFFRALGLSTSHTH